MYLMQSKKLRLLVDETLTVRRYTQQYGEGLMVRDGLRVRTEAAGYRTFQCTGNVQPLSGRDLMQAPEGQRVEGQLSWWIWSDDAEWPQVGDLVERDGLYLVASAEEWGSYVKCRLIRDDADILARGDG